MQSWEAARRRMRGARVGFPLQMLTENRYRQKCAEVDGRRRRRRGENNGWMTSPQVAPAQIEKWRRRKEQGREK